MLLICIMLLVVIQFSFSCIPFFLSYFIFNEPLAQIVPLLQVSLLFQLIVVFFPPFLQHFWKVLHKYAALVTNIVQVIMSLSGHDGPLKMYHCPCLVQETSVTSSWWSVLMLMSQQLAALILLALPAIINHPHPPNPPLLPPLKLLLLLLLLRAMLILILQTHLTVFMDLSY